MSHPPGPAVLINADAVRSSSQHLACVQGPGQHALAALVCPQLMSPALLGWRLCTNLAGQLCEQLVASHARALARPELQEAQGLQLGQLQAVTCQGRLPAASKRQVHKQPQQGL